MLQGEEFHKKPINNCAGVYSMHHAAQWLLTKLITRYYIVILTSTIVIIHIKVETIHTATQVTAIGVGTVLVTHRCTFFTFINV